jgi:uncharacterized membrane protein YbhN (UPF0104 family)
LFCTIVIVQPISDKKTVVRSPVKSETGSSAAGDAHRLRNGLIWTVALAAMLLAIALAVPDLRDVLERVGHAAPGWLVVAVSLEIASCLGYVAVVRLVLRDGPARDVRRLAWAEMAFGAVVPVGGAGGLAVGAWAMRAWGISWSRIANRSAVIFLLTSAVNGTVLVLTGLGVWAGIGSPRTGLVYGLVPALGAALGMGFFVALPYLAVRLGPDRGAVGSLVRRVGSWVRDTEGAAFQRNWRVLGSISYLLFDMGVLWACLRAVGSTPPLLALIVGYQVGYLANLIPIPGGIGVLEGGLLGALLLYGLPAVPTAAAVVLYHAIALWVPTLGGTAGFVRLRKTVSARSAEVTAIAPEHSPRPAAAATRELAA